MWKKKKIEKNKEGTNAKNRKCHCGYSETHAAVKKKKRKQRQDKADKCLKETERKRKHRNKVKQTLKQPPLMILKTVFPIGCRKARPYNQ